MKLYLLTQSFNDSYDTYDSAVVAAPDEATARTISPDTSHVWDNGWFYATRTIVRKEPNFCAWVNDLNLISVTYLGEAQEGTPMGLILSSFNAG